MKVLRNLAANPAKILSSDRQVKNIYFFIQIDITEYATIKALAETHTKLRQIKNINSTVKISISLDINCFLC